MFIDFKAPQAERDFAALHAAYKERHATKDESLLSRVVAEESEDEELKEATFHMNRFASFATTDTWGREENEGDLREELNATEETEDETEAREEKATENGDSSSEEGEEEAEESNIEPPSTICLWR